MSAARIVSNLDNLAQTSLDIITLLNSKRTGVRIASVSKEIPGINLSSSDVQSIFQKLHSAGSTVAKVITDSRKEFNTRQICDKTQNLIDNHAAALQTIIAIRDGQLSKFEHGMMLNAMNGFQNSILNLRNEVITLSSYNPTSSSDKTKDESSRENLKIILKIIAIIIPIIAGGAGLSYYFININPVIFNNSPGSSNNEITNSPNSLINNGQNFNAQNSTNMFIINNQNTDEKTKGELSTEAIVARYDQLKPYSVTWTNCDYPPHEMLQNGASSSQPMHFTPIILDKNGDLSLIPFNAAFTFKIEAITDPSSSMIEPDIVETPYSLVKPEQRNPITLEMIDYFDKAKKGGAHMVKITLIESKIALFSIEKDGNVNYPETIPAKEALMTDIFYFKDQQQQDNWSKMINPESICDNLFKG